MTHVVETHQLGKRFSSRSGPVEAVKSIDLAVEQGEIFGFLGPNGAGKTTTLRMLATLLPIGSGEAQVAGIDVRRHAPQVRKKIGYVSQLGGANPNATGWDNLMLQGRLYGDSKKEVTSRATELLTALDISEFARRKVITYSGGQQRRLDIAMGIIHKPVVLFLDEPTTGLDPQNRANMWDQIRKLRDLGTTIFLTTHYLEEADVLADHLCIMDHGEIVSEGTPKEMKRAVEGDSIRIGLADPDVARMEARLAKEPYVRSVTTGYEHLQLYVSDGSAAMPLLLRLFDAEHVTMRTITLSEPSLDDIFLAKTGRSLRDGSANAEDGA